MAKGIEITIRVVGEDWRVSGKAEVSFSASDGVALPSIDKSTIDSMLKVANADYTAKLKEKEKENE